MPKKRGPGRSKGTEYGTGTLIGVRCHNKFLVAVDKWRIKQLLPLSRAAAIRRLAELGLQVKAVGDDPPS